MSYAVRLIEVSKKYGVQVAVRNVSLVVPRGVLACIVGPSGSGKSTLLNLVSGIDVPDRGEVWVHGERIDDKSDDWRARWRLKNVGVVFQFYHLVPFLTVLENVLLPMELVGYGSRSERVKRALDLLDAIGLEDKAGRFPGELSGGERQRVAIARALACNPLLILADEPTAHLDTENKKKIMELLAGLVDRDRTIVIATHEREFLPKCNIIVRLVDGCVEKIEGVEA